MSEAKHSSLPFTYEYDGTYARKPRIYSADRRLVAEVGNAEMDQDRWEADAVLLTRAISLHAELVAALEEAREFIAADGYRATSELLTTIDITLQKAKP